MLNALKSKLINKFKKFFLNPLLMDFGKGSIEANKFTFDDLIKKFNKKNVRILEIGSRRVTEHASIKLLFNKANVVGIDIHPGPGVDIVCDAHHLADYVKNDYFDLV